MFQGGRGPKEESEVGGGKGNDIDEERREGGLLKGETHISTPPPPSPRPTLIDVTLMMKAGGQQ